MTSAPIRLLIHGVSGRMGRALVRLATADLRFVVVAGVSRAGAGDATSSVPVFTPQALGDCPPFDVAVDFSLPSGFDAILVECLRRSSRLVSGTTGLGDVQQEAMACAGSTIAVAWGSNFSLGVVVLEELARRASRSLPDWRAEIVESHHVRKLDAPSGTALTLAGAVASTGRALPPIQSIREGEIVGEHLLRFSGLAEVLELRHVAHDRDIFARGALAAAAALAGLPAGRWTPAQLLMPHDLF